MLRPLVLGFLIFFTIINIEAKESVPVLIWKNERMEPAKFPVKGVCSLPAQAVANSLNCLKNCTDDYFKRLLPDIPAVSPLHMPFSHLEEKYLQSFAPDNIILFLQDALSVEDLSSYGDSFKHIHKLMDENHSLYLPAVETPNSFTRSFSSHGYNILTLEPGSSIAELKLKGNSKNIVFVKLPSTMINPSRSNALQKNDEVVANVLSNIGKKANFTVIYTAKEPSVKVQSSERRRRVARSLLQNESPTDDSKFYSKNCTMLYLRTSIIYEHDNNSTVLSNKVASVLADCHEYSKIILGYNKFESGSFQKVKLTLVFIKINRSWTLQDVTLLLTIENDNHVIHFHPIVPLPHVPLHKSYSCSQKLILVSNTTTESGETPDRLIINGFQVQTFTTPGQRFSDNWDCVGFFTVPIWMGIFAGVVLILILLIGLFMLSDIKTMDRFDDPKGKYIMVVGATD